MIARIAAALEQDRKQLHDKRRSDQLMLNGVARSGSARVHVDLIEDGAHVSLHGPRTDHQLFSHSAICKALRDHPA